MLKGFNTLLLLLLLAGSGFMASSTMPDKPIVSAREQRWVDSVFHSMTPDQRLGQLFMVTAYSNKDAAHTRQIERLISLLARLPGLAQDALVVRRRTETDRCRHGTHRTGRLTNVEHEQPARARKV